MGRRALIFAGGSWDEVDGPQSALIAGSWDWVICADSGARHALALGLRPDVLVGDFDSIRESDAARLADIPRLRYPAEKDQTDTHIAVEWALDQGADYILIAAGLGTRFDHTLANTHLLVAIAERGAAGVITDGRQAGYLLTDHLALRAPPGTPVSILPLTPVLEGITLRGLRWELYDDTVRLGESRTVSNEFADERGELALKRGMALVIVGALD